MAVDTSFGQLWRSLLVKAPNLPVPEAKKYINTAYSRILGYAAWSFLRISGWFYVPDRYSDGTISITNGSQTLTGVGTAWTSTMVNRQVVIGGVAPFYDIASVDSGTVITLRYPYAGPDLTASSYSLDYIMIEMPTDFLSLEDVRDFYNNWRLRLDISQEQLNLWDAKRTTAGTGWVFAGAPPSAAGLTRYELWPRLTAAKLFGYTYNKRPALMSADSDAPVYPIRGDVILEGALSELSLWPGLSQDNPNIYFNMQSHRVHEERFWKGVYSLEREDQNIRQSNIVYADSSDFGMWIPWDASWIQSHGGLPLF